MLLKILTLLNNFIKYNLTILIFTKIIYKLKIRKALNLLRVNVLIVNTNNANDVLVVNFVIAIIYLIINNIKNNNVSVISLLASY